MLETDGTNTKSSMKIAFYLPNILYKNINYQRPEKGNPGIGGTEYMIIAISYFLTVKYPCKHAVYLFAQNTNGLPEELSVVKTKDAADACAKCNELNIDCLVFPNNNLADSILKCNKINNLKLIVWAHSFMSREQLNLYANSKNVKRIVCVGNEESYLYADHRAYKKMVVIFNAFPLTIDNDCCLPFSKRKNEVTFLGSIVPHTHLHLLAKAWPQVIEVIPDAHLNIIGSGTLYDNNQKMGKWGIAHSEYEDEFMKYFVDVNGDIIPSVTFFGKLGSEKYEILGRTKVGIPNPGGYETFCISALEMQLHGALVVSLRKGGCIDSVFSLENLYSKKEELSDYIITSLSKKNNDYEDFYIFAKEKFSFQVICNKWNDLFSKIESDIKPNPIAYSPKHPTLEHKLIYINKTIKRMIPFGFYFMPSIVFYKSICRRIRQFM